jgi:hypothetical protein
LEEQQFNHALSIPQSFFLPNAVSHFECFCGVTLFFFCLSSYHLLLIAFSVEGVERFEEG